MTYRNSTFRGRAASQTLGLVILAALCLHPARAQQATPGQSTQGQSTQGQSTPGSATSVLPPPLLSALLIGVSVAAERAVVVC